MPKAGFISLGCPKNLVDSEVMMGILARNGYEFTPRAEEGEWNSSAPVPAPTLTTP